MAIFPSALHLSFSKVDFLLDAIPIQMRIISAGHVNDFVMVDLKKLNTSPHDTIMSDHDVVLIYAMKVFFLLSCY